MIMVVGKLLIGIGLISESDDTPLLLSLMLKNIPVVLFVRSLIVLQTKTNNEAQIYDQNGLKLLVEAVLDIVPVVS